MPKSFVTSQSGGGKRSPLNMRTTADLRELERSSLEAALFVDLPKHRGCCVWAKKTIRLQNRYLKCRPPQCVVCASTIIPSSEVIGVCRRVYAVLQGVPKDSVGRCGRPICLDCSYEFWRRHHRALRRREWDSKMGRPAEQLVALGALTEMVMLKAEEVAKGN